MSEYLGMRPVYRHRGQLVVDNRDEGIGDWTGDDVGDELGDLGDELGDELGDDLANLGDAEIGRRVRRKRAQRMQRREGRRQGRIENRERRTGVDIDGDGDVGGRNNMKNKYTEPYQFGAQVAVTAAGTYQVSVTPADDCQLDTLVLDAPAGTAVTQIQIGKEVIVTGVSPATLYTATSTKNNNLSGRVARAGVPCTLTFTTTATSGAIIAGFTGRSRPTC